MKNQRRIVATTLALTTLGAGLTVPSALAAPPASPGAPGIGDKVWPELGNGGYDVLDQQLAFRFNDKLTDYTASTTLTGRATHGLSRFDLDLLGPEVTAVRVNGLRATWKSTPQGELVITPKRAVPKNARFVVKVDVRSKVTGVTDPAIAFPPGLIQYDDWIQAINQPSGARRMLAVSDHPAQKAPATISITGPARLNSIANGKLIRTTPIGKTVTRVFREDRKIATELLQIGVGPFTVVHAKGPHGMDLRYAVPTARLAEIKPQLKTFDESVRFMEQRLGRFPGVRAGAYVAPVGGELETQGLTLMSADAMTKEGFEQNGTDAVVLHEIAHEWFGNSVSPEQWSDLWLNEGHAVFYEGEWSAAKGRMSQSERMRSTYVEQGNQLLVNGPIAEPDPAKWPGENASTRPYSSAAYGGGALVLYALQQTVGTKTFNQIERTWVREHANGLGSTEEFIATASKVAKTDLGPFLRSWLYGTKLPAMPGHPDWKAAPATRQ
ncbi:M1 family metallopeptidase [Kribbella sp. CA-293567]|uniref:M1 family metallopeptidase n=1 Tax=Kribbella sp. CA-293567 TaxID=3002436 RepID=UPI0022DDDA2E|nr:M1 family metallopeptidase [Kribbella sp. CA-293567]WBQ04400.1 M1 family metallopeptidase [Kribbella sp. CA-293567]